jgi:sugar phosphate permease
MTPITREQRAWRIRIFIATWLSYVGFYFCRRHISVAKKPLEVAAGWDTATSSRVYATYLVAYALGQFLASAMGPKLGMRKNVLIGMGASIAVSLVMGVTLSAPLMAGLLFINGLAQATGWSGNVGTMAGWFHKHERGRIMGMWSTNFTTGAIAAGFAMSAVVQTNFRYTFFLGAAVLGLIWLQFYALQRNKPEDVGLPPVDDPKTAVDEGRVIEAPMEGFMGLSNRAWSNLLLVGGFYFCAKFVRYAVWSWAPYFMESAYGKSTSDAGLWAILFDLCGLPGIYLTGWASDKFFQSRRSEVAFVMCLAMTGAATWLYYSAGASFPVFIVAMAVTGFTLYGPDALLSGAGAIDIGGRYRATFAAAVISGFGSIGPVVQELVIGKLYVKGGSLAPVFGVLLASCAMSAVFCAALVWRNKRGGSGI